MPYRFCLSLACLLFFGSAIAVEDAQLLRQSGIQALRESQTSPDKIVDAARAFAKAQALYSQVNEEDKAVEMNSYLYWCRKKMRLSDIEKLALDAPAAELPAPKPAEVGKWLDRADSFAKKNPQEHLLIAIRFFEVADRFKGTPESLAAQDRSLTEQTLAGKTSNSVKPPPAADDDLAQRLKADSTGAKIKPAEVQLQRPVPPAAKLKENEKLLKEMFKVEFGKVAPADRLELATKLLSQAQKTTDDDAALFVLLKEGMLAAAYAGDTDLAVEAFSRRRAAFILDLDPLYDELHGAEASKRPESASTMAALYAYSSAEALARDNPDKALRFAVAAVNFAPLRSDDKLSALIRAEPARIKLLKHTLDGVADAQKRLVIKPNEPAANLLVGKHLLGRGDLEKSLPLLVKSNDSTFGPLAKSELYNPQDPQAQVQLGDAWFSASEKKEAGELKGRLKERALFWYSKALPALSGLAKLKIEGRLKEVQPTQPPAESPVIACLNELKGARLVQARMTDALTSLAVATVYNPQGSGIERFTFNYRFETLEGTLTDWRAAVIAPGRHVWFYCPTSSRVQISFIATPGAPPEEPWLEVNYSALPKERLIASDGKPYHIELDGQKKIVVKPGKL